MNTEFLNIVNEIKTQIPDSRFRQLSMLIINDAPFEKVLNFGSENNISSDLWNNFIAQLLLQMLQDESDWSSAFQK